MGHGRNHKGEKGENCHCWKAFVPTYFLKGHFSRKAHKKGFPVQDLLLTFPTGAYPIVTKFVAPKIYFFLHLNRIHKNNKFFFLLRYAPYNLSRGGAFLKLAQVMEKNNCNKL